MQKNTTLLLRFAFFSAILFTLFSAESCTAQPPKRKKTVPDFVFNIKEEQVFKDIQGEPLTEKYGNVTSVKIIMPRKNGKVYFCNSKKYRFHYEFCLQKFAGYSDLAAFNAKEYSDDNDRHFLLANLNYYQSQNIYALEFFSDDEARPEWIAQLYDSISAHVYFKDRLRLLINSSTIERKITQLSSTIRTISVDELYAGQTYQALNKGEAYGYLRKVAAKDFKKYDFDTKDIVITDALPNDFPFVQGILTAVFQTPLCHINVLSSNRGTPNAALKTAFTDKKYDALVGKLVRYKVTADSIILTTTALEWAEATWAKQKNKKMVTLPIVTTDKTLLTLKYLRYTDADKVGGKAANFAEMMHVRTAKGEKIPMPEGGFAIPFAFYQQHLERNNLLPFLNQTIALAQKERNTKAREKLLKKLEDTIKHADFDKNLLVLIENQVKTTPQYTDFRFRSSTNAEDVPGFNGAGLYTSKTGSLTNKEKPIADAVRKVWASAWNIRAFDEREHANINQKSVAMGVLVHRAFGDEAANGVAITRHLYRDDFPSFTINAQEGETSVVLPTDSVTCDQFILHQKGSITGKNGTTLEYVTKSSLMKGRPVLNFQEVELLGEYLAAIKEYFYHQTNFGKEMNFNNFALDVEFKLEAKTRKLYIKQVRMFN
jgi:pyruvate, water dikinase